MIELDFTRFPVLVVDDEQDNLDAFRFVFRKSFTLHYAAGGAEALSMLEQLDPAVVVSDQRMPGISGIELLGEALRRRPDAVGVLLTAYTEMPLLLEAINSGVVYRYVQKPWDSKELTVILRQAIERFFTLRENRRLREQLARYAGYLETEQRDPIDFGELTAETPAMRAAVTRLEHLASDSSPVLIDGEPGTEKELFARALHVSSSRESRPFVVVSCAALGAAGTNGSPIDALERELLGWERGAFEGAVVARPGRLELANGGTLLMSEVGQVSPAVGARLSRLLRDGTIQRLGDASDHQVDVRIVMTTSDDGAAHPLRQRLNASSLTVPPLRARYDDLPAMAHRLLTRSCARHGRAVKTWSPEAVAKLLTYRWPGNVAELSCVAERAALVCDGPIVGPSFVALGDFADAADRGSVTPAAIDLPGQLDHLERRELCAALERCGGNKAEVARMLGIQRTTLYYRLKRLGIEV